VVSVASGLLAPWDELIGKYAEVGTSVNQESQVADSGSDEQVARSCETGVCLHQRLSLPFSCWWKEYGCEHLRTLFLNRQ